MIVCDSYVTDSRYKEQDHNEDNKRTINVADDKETSVRVQKVVRKTQREMRNISISRASILLNCDRVIKRVINLDSFTIGGRKRSGRVGAHIARSKSKKREGDRATTPPRSPYLGT